MHLHTAGFPHNSCLYLSIRFQVRSIIYLNLHRKTHLIKKIIAPFMGQSNNYVTEKPVIFMDSGIALIVSVDKSGWVNFAIRLKVGLAMTSSFRHCRPLCATARARSDAQLALSHVSQSQNWAYPTETQNLGFSLNKLSHKNTTLSLPTISDLVSFCGKY